MFPELNELQLRIATDNRLDRASRPMRVAASTHSHCTIMHLRFVNPAEFDAVQTPSKTYDLKQGKVSH